MLDEALRRRVDILQLGHVVGDQRRKDHLCQPFALLYPELIEAIDAPDAVEVVAKLRKR